MVKTKSPFLSASAAGSLAGTLIAQQWKGRSYLRTSSIPSNPKSGKQVGVRVMFGFLTKSWLNLTQAARDSWAEDALRLNITPFDKFLQTNLLRHALNTTPGQTHPIGNTGEGSLVVTNSATPQGRGLLVTTNVFRLRDGWGLQLHRAQTPGFVPALENTIAVILSTSVGPQTHFDKPLAPGTYWYKWHAFSNDGAVDVPSPPFMGTVL